MKVFKVLTFGFYLLILNAGLAQSPLQNYIDEWAEHPDFTSTNLTFSVFDIKSGKLQAGHRPKKSAIPASSLKVITTLITLERLGKDFRYKTYVAHDGQMDRDGTVKGNLYVIGSGDPSLGSGRFEGYPDYKALLTDVVSKIKTHGISCIDGDIIVDESIFTSFPVAPTWQWNDLGNYYAGGTWGLNITENEYAIYFDTKGPLGSLAKYASMEPVVDGLTLKNEVTIDSAGSGDNSYIFGGPYIYAKRVTGTLPYSDQLYKIKGSLPDPSKFTASQLHKLLTASEVASAGYSVLQKPTTSTRTIFDSIVSPALLSLSAETNHKSLNLYCESFLRTLALKEKGVTTSEAGIVFIEDYLMEKGLDISGFNMKDGSGLSARSYVSSSLLAGFIADYASRNGIDMLTQQLPQVGKEGTVKSVLSTNKIADNFWMKSGSMDRVVSFTGICKNKAGEWKSFSIIINNYNVPYKSIKTKIEKLLEALWAYS